MDSIEHQLNHVDWKNPESIIRFYESNQLYFDNYEVVADETRISDLIDIKLYYANALGLYNWIFNTASAIGLILVFFDLIFSLDRFLSMDIGLLGAIIAILSYLVQKALTEFYRRKKNALNTGRQDTN